MAYYDIHCREVGHCSNPRMSCIWRVALFGVIALGIIGFCNGQAATGPMNTWTKQEYVLQLSVELCNDYDKAYKMAKKMFETGMNDQKNEPTGVSKEVGLSYLAIAKKVKDKCCEQRKLKCKREEMEKMANEGGTPGSSASSIYGSWMKFILGTMLMLTVGLIAKSF